MKPFTNDGHLDLVIFVFKSIFVFKTLANVLIGIACNIGLLKRKWRKLKFVEIYDNDNFFQVFIY